MSDDHLELAADVRSGILLFLAAALSMLVVSLRLSIPLPRPWHVLHMLASAGMQIQIYLKDKQKRRVEMKFSGVSKPCYEIPATHVPFDETKRKGLSKCILME